VGEWLGLEITSSRCVRRIANTGYVDLRNLVSKLLPHVA